MGSTNTDLLITGPMHLDQLIWYPVEPANPEGPQMAALRGDPSEGPFDAILRVPAGFESPMHTHSNDERVIQLSGRSVHWLAGESRETASVMEPGDYMMLPAGMAHVSGTTDDEESLEFVTMDGAFDVALAEEME